MASTIYFGKSVTASGEQVKKVIVQGLDSTVTRESDFLNPGDILVVQFGSKNTHIAPHIKLYNGSIDNEIAASGDNGNVIKIRAIEATTPSLDGIWSNGEVCTFVYINETNAFYWYLNGIALASDEIYGRVKLATSLENNLSQNTTVTANAILDFINGQGTYDLGYEPNGSQDVHIGTLKLLGLDGEEITRINLYIPEFIDIDTFRTYTDELINNGPKKVAGEVTTEANIGYGHPFITRIVPGRLSFTDSFDPEVPIKGLTVVDNNDEFVAYELANNLGDSTLASQRNLILTPHVENKILLNGKTDVKQEVTFYDKIYLDTTNENIALYNKILELGWDDCL